MIKTFNNDLMITQLIVSEFDTTIEELMDESFNALHVLDDQEEAVKMFAKYDRIALL